MRCGRRSANERRDCILRSTAKPRDKILASGAMPVRNEGSIQSRDGNMDKNDTGQGRHHIIPVRSVFRRRIVRDEPDLVVRRSDFSKHRQFSPWRNASRRRNSRFRHPDYSIYVLAYVETGSAISLARATLYRPCYIIPKPPELYLCQRGILVCRLSLLGRPRGFAIPILIDGIHSVLGLLLFSASGNDRNPAE